MFNKENLKEKVKVATELKYKQFNEGSSFFKIGAVISNVLISILLAALFTIIIPFLFLYFSIKTMYTYFKVAPIETFTGLGIIALPLLWLM